MGNSHRGFGRAPAATSLTALEPKAKPKKMSPAMERMHLKLRVSELELERTRTKFRSYRDATLAGPSAHVPQPASAPPLVQPTALAPHLEASAPTPAPDMALSIGLAMVNALKVAGIRLTQNPL